MRIGVDVSLVNGQKAGIGNYIVNLLNSLGKIDQKNQYLLFPYFYYVRSANFSEIYKPTFKNISICKRQIPKFAKELMWRINVPKKWYLCDCDLLHSTSFCVPMDWKKKLVVTIYDLAFLEYPECHTQDTLNHCTKSTAAAVEHADAIIAISEFTKNELLRYFDIEKTRIHVSHLAADSKFNPQNETEIKRVRALYQLPAHYLLSVGTLEPRKNIKNLIQAFIMLPDFLKQAYPLVISGGAGWLLPDLMDGIPEKERVNIYMTGYVRDEDLAGLYSGAALFVYPSLYEGFGLPVLEAMACGTPVITSPFSSLPEVAGDAAYLCDSRDASILTDAIREMLDNETLRKTYHDKGLKRASLFCWEKTARKTLDIYQDVMTG